MGQVASVATNGHQSYPEYASMDTQNLGFINTVQDVLC